MSVSPYNPERFVKSAPCLPCCDTVEPAECSCALLIPTSEGITGPPYADLATAQAALVNVAGCSVWYDDVFAIAPSAFTADLSTADELGIHIAFGTTPTSLFILNTSLTIGSDGSDISIPFTVSGADSTFDLIAALYNCADGTLTAFGLKEITGGSGSDTIVLSGLAAGGYVLRLIGANASTATNINLTATVSYDGTMVVNPVIALWDDSGTTRQLEACPRLFLPIGIDVEGEWIGDGGIDDFGSMLWELKHTVATGCLASCWVGTRVPVFTAVWASDTLTVHVEGGANGDTGLVAPASPRFGFQGWVSVNAVKGETLSIECNSTQGQFEGGYVGIYDYEGNTVELLDIAAMSSFPLTLESAELPYTGRYTLRLFATNSDATNGPPYELNMTWEITSSGDLSPNSVEILYGYPTTSPMCSNRLSCTEDHAYSPGFAWGDGGGEEEV